MKGSRFSQRWAIGPSATRARRRAERRLGGYERSVERERFNDNTAGPSAGGSLVRQAGSVRDRFGTAIPAFRFIDRQSRLRKIAGAALRWHLGTVLFESLLLGILPLAPTRRFREHPKTAQPGCWHRKGET